MPAVAQNIPVRILNSRRPQDAIGTLITRERPLTDQPLTAVGGAAVLVVVSEILDQVSALGSVRQYLPTHYWLAWLDLLVDPVDATHMTRGLLEMLPWVAVPLGLAFWNFRRKDILS
jgi:ABC-2 type transport system permease protein